MDKENRNYVNLSISRGLATVIDEAVKSGKYAFRSRAELVNDAIRIRLRDMGYKV